MSWDMALPASPPCLGPDAHQLMDNLQKTAFWVLQGQFFLQQAEAGVQFHAILRK